MLEIERVQNRFSKLKVARDFLLERQEKIDKKLMSLGRRIEVRTKAAEILKMLVERFFQSSISKIESLVTFGLREIFEDRLLCLKAVPQERRGILNLDLLVRDEEFDIEGKAFRSFGGGVAQGQSFLLQIIFMVLLERRKFLFLDEQFSMVSAEYQSLVGKVISKICKEFGFKILLVTHNPEIVEFADLVYSVTNVGGKLRIEKKD